MSEETNPTAELKKEIASMFQTFLNDANSQIEKKVKELINPIESRLTELEEKFKKLAELGAQQQEQMATFVNTMNEIGKKVDGVKRASKADIEKTQKGFQTLLDDDD